MILSFFLTGTFIGFFIALPFGGNALLCLKNTLSYGGKSGICSGLGAATVHAVYSFIGISGLIEIETLIPNYIGVLECIGGLFLVYFGVYSFFGKSQEPIKIDFDIAESDISKSDVSKIDSDIGVDQKSLAETYLASTLFAFMNPKSIILSAVMITESGILEANHVTFPLLALSTLGVFGGSTLWWLIFVTILIFMRRSLNPLYLTRLDRFFTGMVVLWGLFFVTVGLRKVWFPSELLVY